MATTIPSSMQVVRLRTFGEPVTVEEAEVPKPGPGQVLIRMAAAPINPSDLAILQGTYTKFAKPLPAIAGLEGSGTVVSAGPGILPGLFVGRRVACAAPEQGGGTWAEYMVTQAARCIPLLPQVSYEAGAMMLVNPLTSMAFISIARQEKHAAIVNTAAASALGQMITRLGLRYGIPVISVVRRAEQADLLRRQGFVHVVDSSQPGFEEALRKLTHSLRATLLLDAIAGESTGQLAAAAPYGSKILLYGALSGQPARVEPWHFLSEAKRLEGFHLANWLQQKNLAATFALAMQVQRLLDSDLQSQVQQRFPLSQAREAVTWYSTNMTTGKVLLIPDV